MKQKRSNTLQNNLMKCLLTFIQFLSIMSSKRKNNLKKAFIKQWNSIVKRFAKWLCGAIIGTLCVACGTTKAVITKPAEGTQTTITITTNNPITTSTPVTTNLNQK